MKKILILLIALPVFCYGQYPIYQTLPGISKPIHKDSLKSKWSDATQARRDTMVIMKIDGGGGGLITADNAITIIETFPLPTLDTIPVIMLVCDTLKRSAGILNVDSAGNLIDMLATTPDVWWKPGYVVRSLPRQWPQNNMLIYPEEAQLPWVYLDRRKKPLEKWIVVWMVKEIN